MLINQKLNNFLKYLKYLKYILILSFVLLLFTSSNQLDNNKQKVKDDFTIKYEYLNSKYEQYLQKTDSIKKEILKDIL